MSRLLFLDAGIIGLLAHPAPTAERDACRAWMAKSVAQGSRLVVPEIADYEVRRELIRARKARGLRHLDELARELAYLPLSTRAMRLAADLWADARRSGNPTAADAALDCDVILASQARTHAEDLCLPAIVVTTNVAHLSLFVPAALWRDT